MWARGTCPPVAGGGDAEFSGSSCAPGNLFDMHKPGVLLFWEPGDMSLTGVPGNSIPPINGPGFCSFAFPPFVARGFEDGHSPRLLPGVLSNYIPHAK